MASYVKANCGHRVAVVGGRVRATCAECDRAAGQLFRCRVCKREGFRGEWRVKLGLMYCVNCVRRHGNMTLDLIGERGA